MGDMGDIFKEFKEYDKERKAKCSENYIPMLEKLGAIKKSDGVYEYKNWFLYPTKGFAMNKQNTSIRHPLEQFIKRNTPLTKF